MKKIGEIKNHENALQLFDKWSSSRGLRKWDQITNVQSVSYLGLVTFWWIAHAAHVHSLNAAVKPERIATASKQIHSQEYWLTSGECSSCLSH